MLCFQSPVKTGAKPEARYPAKFIRATAEARVAMQLDPQDSEVLMLWTFIREDSRRTLGHEP